MSKKSTSIKVGDKVLVIEIGKAHTAATLGQFVADTIGAAMLPKISPKKPS